MGFSDGLEQRSKERKLKMTEGLCLCTGRQSCQYWQDRVGWSRCGEGSTVMRIRLEVSPRSVGGGDK